MKRMKLKIALTIMLAVCTLASCGKTNSDLQNSDKKNNTAATTTSESTSTTVTANAGSSETTTAQATSSDDVSGSDYSVSDLVGEWVQNDTGNILTVNDDGSFSLKYIYGGTRFGTIKIDAEDHPDGSKTYWYSFYEPDNTLWTGFVCPEKPFNEIYSEDEGGMTFCRNITGKDFPPNVPEAKDIRDTLAFADRLMCGTGVNTDTNTEYTTDDGTVYHKSIDGYYKTTDDVRNYLRLHMTEQFLDNEYGFLFGTEHPKCIDVNGELYIEYRPIGGRYSFEDEDPVVVDNGNGYSIEIKNNDYGAEDTVVVEVVKEDGKWKITDVIDNF